MMFSNLYRFAHASIKNDLTKKFKTKLSNLIALDYLSKREESVRKIGTMFRPIDSC